MDKNVKITFFIDSMCLITMYDLSIYRKTYVY